MADHDSFDDRRRALEEEFFKKQNDDRLKKLKDTSARAATRDEIARLTGIANEQVLDALADMKVGAAATMLMSMFPLIEVAWADGQVSDRERQVLIEQSSALGVPAGSEAAVLLAQWLNERPEPSWHQLWERYVTELCKQLKPDDRELLKNEVLGRARLVAEASGGVMGFGWTVSGAEKAVLLKLEKAFA